MTAALIIGTALALCALAYVLYPVFFGATQRPRAVGAPFTDESTDRDNAISALREIEFDRATGKLSDDDYDDLKSRYTERAVVAMRREDARSASGSDAAQADDEIEALVRAYRAQHPGCSQCGPRPEADAVFCSTCGRYLHDRCATCGAPVEALDARYCVNCGDRFAA